MIQSPVCMGEESRADLHWELPTGSFGSFIIRIDDEPKPSTFALFIEEGRGGRENKNYIFGSKEKYFLYCRG